MAIQSLILSCLGCYHGFLYILSASKRACGGMDTFTNFPLPGRDGRKFPWRIVHFFIFITDFLLLYILFLIFLWKNNCIFSNVKANINAAGFLYVLLQLSNENGAVFWNKHKVKRCANVDVSGSLHFLLLYILWCGVAQLVARRLAGRQARVRFSARTEHKCNEEMERGPGEWRWMNLCYHCMNVIRNACIENDKMNKKCGNRHQTFIF